ncbi:serine/threonine-protein phosphatase 4 regulatory subunit 1-like [Babylonia areolata]|uniref:serine/threonine-protein phosphatase 4 regulatory subunit 1-like n=1 Tax=Babylonia areolata TaxID=304850 RepID=UPI003FD1161F
MAGEQDDKMQPQPLESDPEGSLYSRGREWNMLEDFKAAGDDQGRCLVLLTMLDTRSYDAAPEDRVALLDQLPGIIDHYQRTVPQLLDIVVSHVLDVVVRCLEHSSRQVREASHAGLVRMMEQKGVSKGMLTSLSAWGSEKKHIVKIDRLSDVEVQVSTHLRICQCDIEVHVMNRVLDLADPVYIEDIRFSAIARNVSVRGLWLDGSWGLQVEERRGVAVTKWFMRSVEVIGGRAKVTVICCWRFKSQSALLMSWMVTVLGQDITELHILPVFCRMASDPLNVVREVCAAYFSKMCTAVGRQTLEHLLLPKLRSLCEDESWSVRRACSQSFTAVSAACPPELRWRHLPRLFVDLLTDPVRYVRSAAFQQLGFFIATFSRQPPPQSPASSWSQPRGAGGGGSDISHSQRDTVITSPPDGSTGAACGKDSGSSPDGSTTVAVDGAATSSFGTFQYWRLPLPSVDPNLVSGGQQDHSNAAAKAVTVNGNACIDTDVVMSSVNNDRHHRKSPFFGAGGEEEVDLACCELQSVDTKGVGEVICSIGDIRVGDHSTGDVTMDLEEPFADVCGDLSYMDEDPTPQQQPDDAILARQQNVVPHCLLEQFLGMTDPSQAVTVDTDITVFCAYTLPSVASALGPGNWPCIQRLYHSLTQSSLIKVREALARSLHQMALIMGEGITRQDLLPVFRALLQDTYQVRFGVLQHLSKFLEVLCAADRREQLMSLEGCLWVDSPRAWRFRLELAQQLVSLCDLCDATSLRCCVVPLGSRLCQDAVAEVRGAAVTVVCAVLDKLQRSGDDAAVQIVCEDLELKLFTSPGWKNRQVLCQLLEGVVRAESLCVPWIVGCLLPTVMMLVRDPVPNVRLKVAQVVTLCLGLQDEIKNPHLKELTSAVQTLQQDDDRDVRFFACPQDATDTELPP